MKPKLATVALAASTHGVKTQQIPTTLEATALVTTAANTSILQCWKFLSPLNISSTAGTSGAGTFSFSSATQGTTYTVIPPLFDGGLHTAPRVQYVFRKRNALLNDLLLCFKELIHHLSHSCIHTMMPASHVNILEIDGSADS